MTLNSNIASSPTTTSTSTAPTSPSATSAAKMTSTPSNKGNYAAPHTPIASAKRPRNQNVSSAIKSSSSKSTNGRIIGKSKHTYGREIVMNNNNNNMNTSSSTGSLKKKEEDLNLTPVRKMKLTDRNDENRIQMSPMHKPRPAVQQSEQQQQQVVITDNEVHPQDENEEANNTSSNKWVGIFSPVLSFLNHVNEGEEPEAGEEGKGNENKEVQPEGKGHIQDACDTDGDVAMSASNATTTTTAGPEVDVHSNEKEIVGGDTPTSVASSSLSASHAHMSIDANEAYGNIEDGHDVVLIRDEGEEVDTSHDSLDDYHHHYNQEENQEGEDEEEDDEFNPYLFIKFLPPYRTTVAQPDRICLPPKDNTDPPITLVLDLDETLVHCTVDPILDASMVFPVYFNGVQYSVHVRTRPYLQQFLESVSKKFEVVVFTASQKVYADELLNRIDPGEL